VNEHKEDELVSVFQAPDEPTAHLAKSVLDEAGIECMISSRQIPWYDGIMVNAEGYWGDVMTTESQSEQARQILSDYLATPPEPSEDVGEPLDDEV